MLQRLVFLLAAAALLPSSASAAGGFDFTPMIGVRTVGSIPALRDSAGNTVEDTGIDAGWSWSLVGDVTLHEVIQLEVSFSRQPTKLSFDDATTGERAQVDLTVDQYLVGGLFQSGRSYDKLRWFGTASLGVTNFMPEATDSEQRFAFAFAGGAKYRTHTRSAFRFQGKFTSTYLASDDQIMCTFGCFNTTRKFYVNQWEMSIGMTFLL